MVRRTLITAWRLVRPCMVKFKETFLRILLISVAIDIFTVYKTWISYLEKWNNCLLKYIFCVEFRKHYILSKTIFIFNLFLHVYTWRKLFHIFMFACDEHKTFPQEEWERFMPASNNMYGIYGQITETKWKFLS